MKKYLLVAVAAITGCTSAQHTQTPITESAAQKSMRAEYITNKCYTNGHYNSDELNRMYWAISYSVNTWDVSTYDFEAMKEKTERFYSSHVFDEKFCRVAGVDLVKYYQSALTHYNNAQAMRKQQQLTQQQQSLIPTSVNCKQLGAFLNAEIKTFSSGICPIGWVKA